MSYMGLTMEPKAKARWVEALRSGNFKQAMGKLKTILLDEENTLGYCCLGVHAEVEGIKHKIDTQSGGRDFRFQFPEGSSITSPPEGWFARFFTWDPKAVNTRYREDIRSRTDAANYLMNKLMEMNDGANDHLIRRSFKVIATFIDKNL